MNKMALPSGHRIRIYSPGGLRPNAHHYISMPYRLNLMNKLNQPYTAARMNYAIFMAIFGYRSRRISHFSPHFLITIKNGIPADQRNRNDCSMIWMRPVEENSLALLHVPYSKFRFHLPGKKKASCTWTLKMENCCCRNDWNCYL